MRWVAGVGIQPYLARCSQARGAQMRGKIICVLWDSGHRPPNRGMSWPLTHQNLAVVDPVVVMVPQ